MDCAGEKSVRRAAVVLVTGGARSGKSAFAEELSRRSGRERVYLATAEAGDDEMARRIARHRADRGAGWHTVEAPLALAQAIAAEARPGRVVLVDCLTLWLSNLMMAERDIAAESAGLVAVLAGAAAPVILVSNEIGLGLVPQTPLGRRFRDAQGRLNQAVAAAASDVIFVAAGQPLRLKPAPAVSVDWGGPGA
ncbi:bifunctional adenosylcobinamide kinase/adenosylcobinamide-phosphate guanylyltransferase [Pseudoxanthobacter sp.]|uniref:bifunctional adenosylcobinamide kinase/adenosylcobinamide-phosphate guanylyltransferase n=1 Tax=Pseudoxanthobacter sp. TaxID=1925742 RepID=UPI002FDFFDEC